MRERIRATTETIVDEELEAALGPMQSRQSCSALRSHSPVLTGLQTDQTELRSWTRLFRGVLRDHQ